jgi:hypothetical protein
MIGERRDYAGIHLSRIAHYKYMYVIHEIHVHVPIQCTMYM